MDTALNVLLVIWSVFIFCIAAILLIGIAIVGGIILLPLLVFTAAFL